ncbi:MAG: hypothetical protein QM449_07075 [Synergistota bacterium]|nr:hypothetical protein [Synergistota bacterium]
MPDGLYAPMPRSPVTYLSDGINDSITTINVGDVTKLPPAPNIATIGDGEDSETIKYAAKSGNALTGIIRGFEGAAREWNAGVPIANVPCAQHVTALQKAVQGLQNAEPPSLPDDVMIRGADQNMEAKLVAQSNTDYEIRQVRNIFLSTEDPQSGFGQPGDIWIKYA